VSGRARRRKTNKASGGVAAGSSCFIVNTDPRPSVHSGFGCLPYNPPVGRESSRPRPGASHRIRCAALALNMARTRAPGRKPSSLTERAVTGRTSGNPTSTSTVGRVGGMGSRVSQCPRARCGRSTRLRAPSATVSVTSSGRMPTRTRAPAGASAAISSTCPPTSTAVTPASRRSTRPGDERLDADEARDLRRDRGVEDARGGHPAGAAGVHEHGHPVGQRLRLAALVRHQHGGDPVGAQDGAEVGHQRGARRRVEARERLVEQQHLGLEHEARGQRHPLGASPPESVRAARAASAATPRRSSQRVARAVASAAGTPRKRRPRPRCRGRSRRRAAVPGTRWPSAGARRAPRARPRPGRPKSTAEPRRALEQPEDAQQRSTCRCVGPDHAEDLARDHVQRGNVERIAVA